MNLHPSLLVALIVLLIGLVYSRTRWYPFSWVYVLLALGALAGYRWR